MSQKRTWVFLAIPAGVLLLGALLLGLALMTQINDTNELAVAVEKEKDTLHKAQTKWEEFEREHPALPEFTRDNATKAISRCDEERTRLEARYRDLGLDLPESMAPAQEE